MNIPTQAKTGLEWATCLLANLQKQITPRLPAQKREPVITTESDEVQKSVAITAIQSGHGRSVVQSS
jgi:hypothetical protein